MACRRMMDTGSRAPCTGELGEERRREFGTGTSPDELGATRTGQAFYGFAQVLADRHDRLGRQLGARTRLPISFLCRRTAFVHHSAGRKLVADNGRHQVDASPTST